MQPAILSFSPLFVSQVLHKSGVGIKDRQILVDLDFCTNDPNIFAAGKNVVIKEKVFYQYTHTSELEMAEKVRL